LHVTACQQDAANGLFAQATSGFIRWVAARYDEIRRSMVEEVRALREKAVGAGSHRRTPEIVANLMVGLRYFLRYAAEVGAVSADEAKRLEAAWWAALGQAASAQAEHHEASECTNRFQALLRAALASGEAHVAGPDGREPENPAAWGWRPIVVGGATTREEWRAQGRRIGWVDGDHLYLEPEASFAVVQRLGHDSGEPILVTSTTLRKRFREKQVLRSYDAARGKLTVRRTLEGRRLDVLHVSAAWSISTEPAQSAQPAHEAIAVPVAGGVGEWEEV
jgi:hypothetical protein